MFLDEEPPPSTPEWVYTYADMMSLLLTLFIMIVSMSEMKKDDKFQGVADAIERQFGYADAIQLAASELHLPRDPVLAGAIAAARQRREQILSGSAARTRSSGVGAVVLFSAGSMELSSASRESLRRQAASWREEAGTIEIRGFSATAQSENSPESEGWDAGFQRARAVATYLIEELEFERERLKIAVAHEPKSSEAASSASDGRGRVELLPPAKSADE